MNRPVESPASGPPGPPRLSIVAAARHDEHGGPLLQRLECFLHSLFRQAERARICLELVLVEWNPLPDRPSLREALQGISPPVGMNVRLLRVPPEVHQSFPHADRISFFQFIAKNTGIRSARGEFVLATNVDVIFSDELFDHLASVPIHKNTIYRADRWDVEADLPAMIDPADLPDFCRRHVQRVFTREGVYPAERYPAARLALWEKRPSLAKIMAFVQFIMQPNSRPHWLLSPDSCNEKARRRIGRTGLLLSAFRHLLHPPLPPIHLGASGDFTLMAKEHWHALHGYPEWSTFPIHMDSVLCLAAFYAGIQEIVLLDPMRVYHLSHDSPWGPAADWDGTLDDMQQSSGIEPIRIEQLVEWSQEMRRSSRPLIFNTEQWGLETMELEEIMIQ